MQCLQCSHELVNEQGDGYELWSCRQCQSHWLPGTSLEARLSGGRGSAKEHFLQLAASGSPSDRLCLDCGRSLKRFIYKEVELDLCPGCKGLFLDAGELNKVGAVTESATKGSLAAEILSLFIPTFGSGC